jgi:hypothetical protein
MPLFRYFRRLFTVLYAQADFYRPPSRRDGRSAGIVASDPGLLTRPGREAFIPQDLSVIVLDESLNILCGEYVKLDGALVFSYSIFGWGMVGFVCIVGTRTIDKLRKNSQMRFPGRYFTYPREASTIRAN